MNVDNISEQFLIPFEQKLNGKLSASAHYLRLNTLPWVPLGVGAGSGLFTLFNRLNKAEAAERGQSKLNERNLAILQQSGQDMPLKEAKLKFPQFFEE